LQEGYEETQSVLEEFKKDLKFSGFIQKEIFKAVLEDAENSGIKFIKLDIEVGHEEIGYPEQLSLKIADIIEEYI